jgi:hypothetical protein
VPFPYFAEVMTGFEYTAATHMIFAGLVREGVECITNIRRRYDGERRNPWDEAECGSHYARAMAAWTGILALSGFRYDAPRQAVTAVPRLPASGLSSIWATGTGWGTFTYGPGAARLTLAVLHGTLPCRSLLVTATLAAATAVRLDDELVRYRATKQPDGVHIVLEQDVTVRQGQRLVFA